MAGWLYLTAALIGAGLVANARRPSTGPALLVPSWLAALLTVDLALHHLTLMVVVTVGFYWAGALLTVPGKLGLLLALASGALLVITWWPAQSAAGVVEATARSLGLESAMPVPRLRFIAPFQRVAPGVTVTRDVEFFRTAGRALKLDVFRSQTAAERRPALIYLHGGAWMFGDKATQGLPLCNYLATLGWVCFNANHRLSPGATYPDHVVDCKAAIAWVRKHADDWGVNPDFIALSGGSSGAHIIAMTALTANDADLQPPGFEAADTSVQAVVSSYGVYDLTNRLNLHHHEFFTRLIGPLVIKAFPDTQADRFAAASPRDHVERGTMPWLMIHGEADSLAPVAEARDFADALRAAGNQWVGYAELPRALHGFDVWYCHRAIAALELTARFLNTVYGRATQPQES